MIQLNSVSKTFVHGAAEVVALSSVTLKIESGEKLCVVGTSGSGKSTLLDVIGTLLTPTGGEYRLDGRNVSRMDGRALATARNRFFGFVFQAFHLLERMTVIENVLLGRHYRERDPGYEKRALNALDALGIGTLQDRYPQQLSGGQRQRVAIARAIAGDPQVILADEPTGNLDSASGAKVIDALLDVCRPPRALIVITHDQAVANRFPRLIRMRDGRAFDS